MLKSFVRSILPPWTLKVYHWLLAKTGSLVYGLPSRKLIVIGVTGTKGKSTVCNLIAKLLSDKGYKVGLVSTIKFQIAGRKWDNKTKQTMPGRFQLQKLLSQMVKSGCRYAIIETSSEGIAQYRHIGIDYDIAVFTNLSPEHIESHGSYEKYKQAKVALFKSLSKSHKKKIKGQSVKKVIVANHDDAEVENFLFWSADKKYSYGLHYLKEILLSDEQVIAREVKIRRDGISFAVDGTKIDMSLLGKFNVYNSLAAIAIGFSQGLKITDMKASLESVEVLPGRMEEIKNKQGFRVFIDYAHEPASLEEVYKTIRLFRPKKVISVLGSQGGGRDKAKRPILGRLAADYTDHIIVTNEDPYDEDPEEIINEVMRGAIQTQKKPVLIEKIVDRREAIKRALYIAQPGDVVIITGKGSETVMAVKNGRKIPWDDRKVVKSILF